MFCTKVKEFLSKKGVQYTERDIAKDQAAISEMKKMGFMTTPITVIDGRVVIGYDTEKLDELLKG
ncbi:MAG: glutaredoxin family protein [Nitrospiraceae bacterium]|nr:MAG: glutaredoxin family protein [Nitrospiraceae bacterium]